MAQDDKAEADDASDETIAEASAEEASTAEDEGEAEEYEDEEDEEEDEQEDEGEDEPADEASDEPLAFDRAELDTPRAPCARCHKPLEGEYYEADAKPVCSACARIIRYGEPDQTAIQRAMFALGFGIAAAIASGFVWWGVSAVFNATLGLVAVVVGLAVGFAVRYGSRARGGWFYQTMAVVLTYLAIVSNHVPAIMDELRDPVPEEGSDVASAEPAPPAEEIPTPLVFVIACVLAIFAPIWMGLENIIGLAIMAFALWEAWRVNKRAVKKLLGPYALARNPPSA